jgi:hypothetical protein
MKPGVSTLNPYAASYIPLSARSTVDKIKVAAEDSKIVGDSALFGSAENRNYGKSCMNANALGSETFSMPEVFATKNHHRVTYDSYGSPVPLEYPTVEDEFDMDLEFLCMQFPGLSVESLADVYMANNRDLDAAFDMLSQLEYNDNLPETLDIGDISESGSSKLKNVVGEASTSSVFA